MQKLFCLTRFAWNPMTLCLADVNLTRTADALCRVVDKLAVLSNPAWQTSEGEQWCEHLWREAHCFVNQARIEIDVWIQLTSNEVLVRQSNFLKALSDIEEFILRPEAWQDFVSQGLHNASTRVEVLIDAVTEARKAERKGQQPLAD